MPDEGDRLGHELSAAIIRFHEALANRLALNVTEHKALDEILYAGPTNPSELAIRLGVSRAAVTKIVARLSDLGYVVGRTHAGDARRLDLVPTDAIREVMAELYAPLSRDMAGLLDGLDEHQQRGVGLWLAGSIEALRSAAVALEEHG